jgi:alkylhydroperoxidase family enzyme
MKNPDGWVPMVGKAAAQGRLREAYEAMARRATARPAVYETASGEVPNIVRAHSLDPEGLELTFSMSAAVHWGPLSLPWVEREMLNTVTSAANGCFY